MKCPFCGFSHELDDVNGCPNCNGDGMEWGEQRPAATLVHGFNVRDGGESSIWRLSPYIEKAGFSCRPWTYGWIFLVRAWGTYWVNKHARRLAATDRADVLVAHSHGCNLANEATWRGHPARILVLINPALDRDTDFAPSVKRVHVYHWPRDLATTAAALLPFHRWGDMGAAGYQGDDYDRVRSWNAQEIDPAPWWVLKRHSRILQERVSFWGPRIAKNLDETWKLIA